MNTFFKIALALCVFASFAGSAFAVGLSEDAIIEISNEEREREDVSALKVDLTLTQVA